MSTRESDSSLIHEAIAKYHDLLRGPYGETSARQLEGSLRAHHLVFGTRTICRVLRPFFLTEREEQRLREEIEVLMRAFRKLSHCLALLPRFRKVLGLSKEEEEILAVDQQAIEPDAIARIDGFLIRDGAFKVIEYNAESPGGIAFGDTLANLFSALPVMREFQKSFRARRFDGLENTLEELLAAHRARVGPYAARNPTIAVVDFKSAPTHREFEICAEFFTRRGYPSRVIEPSELSFRDGRLFAGDFRIDIVYKRVLVKDLLKIGGAGHPLALALHHRAVSCASGFGVHLLYRKELFALLYDEELQAKLSEEERATVARTVPWTRLVSDSEVFFEGKTRRLKDVILERRENLVLKPTAEYGGEGVALGWLETPSAWEKVLDRALHEPYVVQQRVALPHEEFPVWANSRIEFSKFYADINPFVWGGRRALGFGGRLAAGELLNVTAGGGSALPVFVLSRR